MLFRTLAFILSLSVAFTLTLPKQLIAEVVANPGHLVATADADDDEDDDSDDEGDDSDDDDDSDSDDEVDDSDNDEDDDSDEEVDDSDDDDDDDSDDEADDSDNDENEDSDDEGYESDDADDDDSDDEGDDSDDADDDDSDDEGDDSDEDDDDDSDDEGDDSDDDENDENDDSDDEDFYATPSPVAPEGSQLKVSLERTLLGTLEFEVDLRGVPVGNYDLLIGGIVRASIQVLEKGDSTQGEIEFSEIPEGDDLVLDFEILGQLIEIAQESIIWFSVVAPFVANVSEEGYESDVEEDNLDGSVSSSTELSSLDDSEGARVRVKYEKEYDGELVLEIEAEGLPIGEYKILVSGVDRGFFYIRSSRASTYGEATFESIPDRSTDRLLDFNASGELIQLVLGEETLFEGVIPLLVADPAESPLESDYVSVSVSLFPDIGSVILLNGLKKSDWFGVYDDTLYPIIEHCVLGRIEHRFDSERNIIVSDKYGALEILRDVSSNDYVYYSFDTGRIFSVSETTDECLILDPVTFVDEEDERFDGIFPDADDPEGFYHLAFEATQKCQVASSETIKAVQNANRSDAFEKLSDTTFYRELAVNNANRVKQAAAASGINSEFWNDAADHLIAVASEALLNAQQAVSSM